MSHTKGPWETDLRADRDGDWYAIEAEIIAGRRSGTVADTLNRDHCIDPDEDRANAKLIAAAPDLLAVLESVVERLKAVDMDGVEPEPVLFSPEFQALIEAAITKAKGDDTTRGV